MSSLQEGCAIQVVKVKNDHIYKLDEAALSEILLRKDIQDMPVAVVSVAGAYRGGKSFLLNFFLKYLKATESQRKSNDWLGPSDSPLDGFRWRSGCDRETTGIHLWSEPIKINCKGKTVAVLLMDTQGTFDSCSTVRDNSTIFALSTLLSSVQIYNLKENIKEDDLQHLHLFTEYGKLAQEQEETAFQVLTFLVRDWPYPRQHSYGIEGGNQLLTKRLEITASHNQDMRNLRESIQSCFQSVTGFLMPHPGFEVSEEDFKGNLSDIREVFQTSLLELLPDIFQSNLSPKVINGNSLKCRDLFEYFKTFMTIFNSNVLPEPVTIMKATSEAALMTAERDACEVYEREMEAACGPRQPSMPTSDLHCAHQQALLSASETFNSKKKMGSQSNIDECLNKIMANLESQLPSYEVLNDAKLKSAHAKALKVYEDTIAEVSGDQILCLHPNDLHVLHVKAVTKAIEVFDTLRKSTNPDDDEERNAVVQQLEDNIKDLRNKNDQNNMGALMRAQNHYLIQMASAMESGTFLSQQFLEQRHEEAMQSAMNMFNSSRNMPNYDSEDTYLEKLEMHITEQHRKNAMINKNANRTAVHAALHSYNNHITESWHPQVFCLHPDDLNTAHQSAMESALQEFVNNRVSGDDDKEDGDKANLLECLEIRRKELTKINETCNERAVEEAYAFYAMNMEKKCRPSLLSLLVVPLIMKIVNHIPEYHRESKGGALGLFLSRRANRNHRNDKYYDELERKLDGGYDIYCIPMKSLAREIGINV